MNHQNAHEDAVPAEPDDLDDQSGTAITGLALLSERVERLVQLCGQLAQENRLLHEHTSALQAERDALREKNEQSRARIDAMVVRLRDLEPAP